MIMDWSSTRATRWNSSARSDHQTGRCGSVALRLAHVDHQAAGASGGRKASSVAEAFQTYINMVTGVTKSTQARASATARALLKQAGLEDVAAEASERVNKLAEEIMTASRTNRELLQHFVTAEVDKAVARLGLARAEDIKALQDEIASLRAQLKEASTRTTNSAPAKKAATKKPAARKTAATMTPTKKTAAAKSPGRKPPRKTAATAENVSQPGEK
jgi:Poly(hydroxyalcanoate) granule associated protein (phasin)